MSHPSPEFMRRYLAPLVGCVVTEIKDAGDGFTAIVFEKDGKRYECELSADEEGNDSGFLFGLPIPAADTVSDVVYDGKKQDAAK